MRALALPAAALMLLGRHGTLIAAGSIFVGLAVPPLAAACKPYLGEVIVVNDVPPEQSLQAIEKALLPS